MMLLLNSGCAEFSSGSSSVSSTLTLAGKLSVAPTTLSTNDNIAMDVDTSNLKVKAVAFTNPPTIVESDVASDGSFSVNLPAGKGTATTAYFIDKTDDSQQGVLVFEDTSTQDMNGNSSQSSSVVLKDSVNLGTIVFGTDGKVKVPVSTIANQIGSSSSVNSDSAFDPTGVWYMKAFDGIVPSGYQTVSTCGMGNDGPCIGFPITLSRYAGKSFVKGAGLCTDPAVCPSTSGTIGSADRYALSIWGGSFNDSIGACGSKTGFTADEARGFAGIHLTTLPTINSNPMSFGPYAYAAGTGFGGDSAPFNKHWMKTAATLSHDLQNCRPMAITNGPNNYKGWACRSTVKSGMWPGSNIAGPVYGWQVGVEGGGCFNTVTNKPVNVTNWSAIGHGTCTQTDVSSTYGAGFMKNTCTYSNADHDASGSTPAISLSCTHTGGQVTDSAGSPTSSALVTNPGEYLGQPVPIALAGARCDSIGSGTDSLKLAAYRCYAEAYWNGNPSTGSTCSRDYRFNWSATTPADFAEDSGRGKPKNAFITNILNYSADGETATLEDEEINTMTISTGASSSTFCKASRRTTLTFKKISATRLMIDLRESGQMNSTNAACIGAAKDALADKEVGGGDLKHILTPQNMLFYADTSP